MPRVATMSPDTMKLLRAVQRALDENSLPVGVRLAVICQAAGKLSYEMAPTDDPETIPDSLFDNIVTNLAIGREYAKE